MSVQNSQGSGGLRLKKQRSGKFQFGFQLNVKVYDIDFEPGTQDDKDKEEVGFYVYRNMKFVDCSDLEDPHTVMVPLRNAKPEEVVRIIVQNLDDEEFFGSISVPLKKYFLNDTIVKNHEYKQWITLFDDPEDDEYDGDLEDDDEDHPKIQISFSITEVQFGPGGQVVQPENPAVSIKTGHEVDQSSMISPPRDTDMTSQIESNEGAVMLNEMHKTQSLVNTMERSKEEFKSHTEFQRYSSNTNQQSMAQTMQMSQSAVINQEKTVINSQSMVERNQTTFNSSRLVQENNFMEVADDEQKQPTTGRDSLVKTSPQTFQEADARVVSSEKKRYSNEFKTKSGIKVSNAFHQESAKHLASTFEEQDVTQEVKVEDLQNDENHFDALPLRKDDSDDDMQANSSIPVAASRPAALTLESKVVKKNIRRTTVELQPRSNQFSDLNQNLGLERQVSLNTAAEAAKHRRSTVTGLLRGQREGSIDPEHLSFLFGGSAKPKLATVKVNVHKEKEKSILWIKHEQKKYNLGQLKQDLTAQIQTTVYNIKKEQKDIINDDKRQIHSLVKIEQFHVELEQSKKDLQLKAQRINDLQNKAQQGFSQFDEARNNNMSLIQTQLHNKKKELQDLKDEEAAQNAENNRQKQKIQHQRQQHQDEGIEANPDCLKTMNDTIDLENQLEQARKKNLGEIQKTKTLRTDFDKLKSNYYSQIDDLRRKLDTENKNRENNQGKAISNEQEAIEASNQNFNLKAEVFQRQIDLTKLDNKKQQADRNIKLLTEKKKQLDTQIQVAQQNDDTQQRKIQTKLNQVNTTLSKAKQDCDNSEAKLQDLQQKNDQIQSENWESKLKALQGQLEDKENQNQDTQAQADNAMAQMGAKINVFKDPFFDRATETDEIMAQIRNLDGNADDSFGGAGSGNSPGERGQSGRKDHLNDLKRQNDDLKAKADRLNDLRKKKDDLEGRRMKRQGIDELKSGLQKACNDYDHMADDLEQQVSDMGDITQRVNQAIEDRGAALDEQIGQNGELSLLKMKKLDQDRELINLDKEISNLKSNCNRYGNDIRDLQDEKDILVEHVDQLDQLVQARENDLAHVEGELDACTQKIDFLQAKITEQGKLKKPAKLFSGKRGDMLDELLGNYINETGCPVPIQRLGNGFYMFGTRKIFAKVLNGRLVIRVGGGFMVIEEFISAYAEQEMRKKKHKEDLESAAAAGLPPPGSSPRAGTKGNKTITAVADTRLSGTTRTKKFTESQLKNLQAHGGVRVVKPH